MALKLDPVRLLIADDVGIGKTIEAGLIARELLDQGDARAARRALPAAPRRAVAGASCATSSTSTPSSCCRPPPPGSSAACAVGQSLFERYPHVVVSTDFIKSDRRRDEFVRACPELVIVDEAHTCARRRRAAAAATSATSCVQALGRRRRPPPRPRHRHAAQRQGGGLPLAARAARPDVRRPARRPVRRADARADRQRLARHLVQRRRADIRALPRRADTPFPDRDVARRHLRAHARLPRLFDDVLDYAREIVRDAEQDRRRQRVRWWSALGAAALARLQPRRRRGDAAHPRRQPSTPQTVEEADEIGRRAVLDHADDEAPRASTSRPAPTRRGRRRPRGRRAHAAARRSPRPRRASPATATPSSRPRSSSSRSSSRTATTRSSSAASSRPPSTSPSTCATRSARTSRSRPSPARCRRPSARARIAALGCARAARAGRHRLPERGHQPPGPLRRRRPLRPGLEPDPPRAARGPRRPLRPGARHRARGHLLRRRTTRSTASCSRCCCASTARIRSQLGVSVPVPADAGKVVEAILEGVVARGRDDVSSPSSCPCSPRSARSTSRSCTRSGTPPASGRSARTPSSPSTRSTPTRSRASSPRPATRSATSPQSSGSPAPRSRRTGAARGRARTAARSPTSARCPPRCATRSARPHAATRFELVADRRRR